MRSWIVHVSDWRTLLRPNVCMMRAEISDRGLISARELSIWVSRGLVSASIDLGSPFACRDRAICARSRRRFLAPMALRTRRCA
jgi:hypothetical protein